MRARLLSANARKRIAALVPETGGKMRTYHRVADASLGLPWHWVSRFYQGAYDNPTIHQLDLLLDALDAIDGERTT